MRSRRSHANPGAERRFPAWGFAWHRAGHCGLASPENRAAITIPENWTGVLRRVLRSMDEASLRVLELARCSPLPLIRSETIGPQSAAAPMPEG